MKSSPSSPSLLSPADASTCTLPRLSSSFPSSFTPFYPRSQQYYGYPGLDSYNYGESPAEFDLNASDSYSQDGQDFYGQPEYANWSEYEHAWITECPYSRDVWECRGNWQWGNSSYVDSAYTASKSSSHNLPPNLLSLNSSIPSIGKSTYASPHNMATSFLPDRAFTVSSAFKNNTLPVLSSRPLNKKMNITKLKPESKGNTSENQTGSGKPIDASEVSSPENLDRKSISFKSAKMLSAAVTNDKQVNEQFTKIKGSYSSESNNGNINNTNNEDPLDDNTSIKGAAGISANYESGCSSYKGVICSSLSECSGMSHSDIGGAILVSRDKAQHEDVSPISSHVNDSQIAQPTEGLICQSSKGTSTAVSDGFADTNPLHERTASVYDPRNMDNLDGSQLLIKSIYHLSMVLSKTKSTALNSFDSKDLAIVKSIYMLSLSLTQDSQIDEGAPFMGKQIYQVSAKSVANTDIKEDVGIHSILDCLNPLVNVSQGTSSFGSSSCRKAEGADVCTHVSTASEKCWVHEENTSINGHLLELKDNFLKLQDDIAYERTESNVTVSMYKNLWTEAHDELEAFKLKMLKIKDDLNGMNDLFENLKNTGHMKTTSGCLIKSCDVAQNEYISCKKSKDTIVEHHSENPEICGQSLANLNTKLEEKCAPTVRLMEDCNSVPKGNSSDAWISLSMPEMKETIKHTMNLESEVSQRLSVLLARPKIEREMSCSEDESVIGNPNLYEYSTDVLEGDQSEEVSYVGHNAAFLEISPPSSERSCLGDNSAKHLMNCIGSLPKYLMKCNADLPTMVGDGSWDCEEDESEVIYLRPKRDTEWEHIEHIEIEPKSLHT